MSLYIDTYYPASNSSQRSALLSVALRGSPWLSVELSRHPNEGPGRLGEGPGLLARVEELCPLSQSSAERCEELRRATESH